MFNFNLFEKALLDNNLSDKDKVLASYLMKKISQSKTGEVEMYIGFLANEVLNCSDSSVKRALRSITEKGYIVKRNGRGKGNKKPVIIRLNDEKSRSLVTPSCESRGQNEPKVEVTGDLLKNSNKKNNTKNSHSITSPISTSTCDENNEDNQSNTEEKMDNTNESMMEKSDAVSDAMASNESTKNETGAKVKLTSDELKKRNDYISSIYNKLDTSLNYLNSVRYHKIYCDTYDKIYNIFQDAVAHKDWFTDGQWKKLEVLDRRFIGITEYRNKYFNGTKTDTDADAETISMGEETNLNAGTEENGDSQSQCDDTPKPRRQQKTTDEIREWVMKQCEKHPDYASWEKDFEKKIVKKYTSDWANNAEAGKYYNFCTGIADKYFKEKVTDDDAGIDYLLKASEEEIAPWEEESKPVQMKQEDWHSKYGHLIKH